MEFSKQYLNSLAAQTGFIKETLEKVLRLAEVLRFLNADTVIGEKLALKGGTAINLTAVELPRLSVDIDLDYAENVAREELPAVKEKIGKRLTDYMFQEGYSLIDTREYFALTSFVFGYINCAGNRDNIKVEVNYLDRCHILSLEKKSLLTKGIIGGFDVLTLNTTELYASKINALLSRATPRDLYDVHSMIERGIVSDKTLLKKCLIFYSVIAGNYSILELNYSNLESLNFYKFKTQLKPVIAKTDPFDIEKAKTAVLDYLKELIVLTAGETEFVLKMKEKVYDPSLLFDDEEIVRRIANHPAALWRTRDTE